MNTALAFLERFRPAPHAHGIFTVNASTANGKQTGRAITTQGAVTEAQVERHLAGEGRLGFIPIHRDGTCSFGAIDIDDYKLDHTALAAKIKRLKLPLVLCKSKSGGAHLYWFLPKPWPAAAVREKLSDWAAALGYGDVEIYPKQDTLNGHDTGNWINAPYHGSECWAVDDTGNSIPLDQFLGLAERSAATPAPEPLSQIEKCAAVLAEAWTPGRRDDLAVAVYGTLLRHKWSAETCDELIRVTTELAADEEAALRIKGAAMERRLAHEKNVPGIRKLKELIGDERAGRFLRLAGVTESFDLGLRPVAAEWLDALPPALEFTVKPLLPRRTVGMLVAEGGTGKTNFLLRLAVCVATGRPFFGLEVAAGRVAYAALEDNEDSLRRRLHWIWCCERERLQRDEKASPEAIDRARAALVASLSIASLVGRELHLVRMHDGQAVQNGGVLDDLIQQLEGTELLVLDPMARLSGAEENNNAVGTAMINAAERIAREAGCAVLIAHHTGKANAKDRDTSLYAARGASGFADAARSVIRLLVANAEDLRNVENISPEAIAAGDVVRVIHSKCNEAARLPEFWLRRQESDFALWAPERGGADAALDAALRRLHDWWTATDRQPFSQRTAVDARDAAFGGGVSRDRARSVLEQAKRRGDLIESAQTAEHSRVPLLTFRSDYDPDPM